MHKCVLYIGESYLGDLRYLKKIVVVKDLPKGKKMLTPFLSMKSEQKKNSLGTDGASQTRTN